jgi:hypothetical protein
VGKKALTFFSLAKSLQKHNDIVAKNVGKASFIAQRPRKVLEKPYDAFDFLPGLGPSIAAPPRYLTV